MAHILSSPRLQAACDRASRALIEELDSTGHWTGRLSSSALSTATAVVALSLADREGQIANPNSPIARGLAWLSEHANDDGGWGDTTFSLSNLSTTTLCWAAFGAVTESERAYAPAVRRAEQWLMKHVGIQSLDDSESIAALAQAIIARYGKDRTFSVPILTMCALAGRLGIGREAWRHVMPLPFELAAFPRQWFAALRLPVVSYALPALIAIGQARYHHAPPRNPVARAVRAMVRSKTLRVLESIQPPHGGFLEATPLTSFVTMSLAGSGRPNHPVTRRGVSFLLESQTKDGSWPIDTNLATWVTTLSVNALNSPENSSPLDEERRASLRAWLLGQQYRQRHSYTNAAPGGWAWTDLPGGVPDADDTAGALLALHRLNTRDEATLEAAAAGINWLLDLQNGDGGLPTFCRGWGHLPFDRSSADITAHAVRAWLVWRDRMPGAARSRIQRALSKAVDFLARAQREDGAWIPLWFGNQFDAHDENPVYGTSRVVVALSDLLHEGTEDAGAARRLREGGVDWIVDMQKEDGSWSGAPDAPSSMEESALAIEALAGVQPPQGSPAAAALQQGLLWLVEKVEDGDWTKPSPIGFYFAKLWYYERLYPMIFTVSALRKAIGSSPR